MERPVSGGDNHQIPHRVFQPFPVFLQVGYPHSQPFDRSG
jgi:hypothetical protein